MTGPSVTVLGSGGWIPRPRRATSCVAVRGRADELLLFDAGSGVANLWQTPDLLEGVKRVDVLLSHFHLDHIIGLSYLPRLAVEQIHVWGPGEALGQSTAEILGTLLAPPYFSAPLRSFVTSIHELFQGINEVGTSVVRTRIQPRHPGQSMAFRIGEAVTYCTDTAYDSDNAEFAKHCRLLIHEAWGSDNVEQSDAHCSASDAARIASSAEVEELALYHLPPSVEDFRPFIAAANRHFPRVVTCTDGARLS